MSETLSINIKYSNDKKLVINDLTKDIKVLTLKEKINEQLISLNNPIEPEKQILIYAGRILKNDETLEEIKIRDGNTIHMVQAKSKTTPKPEEKKEAQPAPQETTTASTTTPTTTSSIPQTQPTTNTTQSTPQNNTPNPFGLFGAAPSPFAQGMGMNFLNGQLPPIDNTVINSLLENPNVINMMSQMFSNPQFMDMLINSNPNLAQFTTPEVRNTMNQLMSNPDTLRSILQLNNAYSQINNNSSNGTTGGAATAAPNPFNLFQNQALNTTASAQPNTTPAANTATPDLSALLNMFGPAMGGMGMGNPAATANTGANAAASQQPPEVRFETQLAQLQDMGFYDSTQNIRALTISGGRVEAAVEWVRI